MHDCDASNPGPLTSNRFDLESTIRCPVCGHLREEVMPTDACLWFYECVRCKTILRPQPGDCCVFCSYGTNRCPPKQAPGKGCGSC